MTKSRCSLTTVRWSICRLLTLPSGTARRGTRNTTCPSTTGTLTPPKSGTPPRRSPSTSSSRAPAKRHDTPPASVVTQNLPRDGRPSGGVFVLPVNAVTQSVEIQRVSVFVRRQERQTPRVVSFAPVATEIFLPIGLLTLDIYRKK